MIDRIISFSIRNRWLVIVAGFLLALAGIYAVYRTPVDAIPDLSENQVIVFTDWTGHGPQEIEDQVTYPLTLHLQGIAGVRVVRSSSDFNFSMISIIFEDAVPWATAREQVSRRLAGVRDVLPQNAIPALAPDAAATGQIFWYTVEGSGYDLARLRAIQDWYIRPQLSSVAGVAEVASVGGHIGEYAVEIDPRRLAALSVQLSDVIAAVEKVNAAVGGGAIHKANAEYIVRGIGGIGQSVPGNADFDPQAACRDLENVIVPRVVASQKTGTIRLAEVAAVRYSPAPRRGVLEKDGNEVTGGVVLMRQGANALEVTRLIKEKIQSLHTGLPPGVRIVSFYDRTPLIEGSIATVTVTLIEAILTATVCVLLVLLHFRATFVVSAALPLAALSSFIVMGLLRWLGVVDIQTNIMSMAGIAISIGALVDSSIVMAENVMHRLHEQFGDRPVKGDVRNLVHDACSTVGRPIFFSVVIMLLSFLPVFALGGIEGKMFRPLAFTKCFALVAVAVLAITLVPALCTVCIRGRLRSEMDSLLIRNIVVAYRPVLTFVLDHPAAIVWFAGTTFLVGLAPLGQRWITLLTLGLSGILCLWAIRSPSSRAIVMFFLTATAIVAGENIKPLGYEPATPLDEGMVMDMPITVPWASVAESADDLKARDMILCRFPEVDMVVGKAGRAETATDPAPLDMIETMVNFRPQDLWPQRKMRMEDAERSARGIIDALERGNLIATVHIDEKEKLSKEAVDTCMSVFDAQMREFAYQSNQEFERQLGHTLIRAGHKELERLLHQNGSLRRFLTQVELQRLTEPSRNGFALQLARDLTPEDVSLIASDGVHQLKQLGYIPSDQIGNDSLRSRPSLLRLAIDNVNELFGGSRTTFTSHFHTFLTAERHRLWTEHIQKLNGELHERSAPLCTRLLLEELLSRCTVTDPEVTANLKQRQQFRADPAATSATTVHHHRGSTSSATARLQLEPYPPLDRIQNEQSELFAKRLILHRNERSELAGFGGELDRAMQMPGWTNVWTMPIQNRVDMLATGINTTVGVRVLGRNIDDVVRVSEEVAAVVTRVPGAANVVADRLRGKGYLQIRPDRERAARLGVSVSDINELVGVALGGKIATQTIEARERHPVRIRYSAEWRADEESARSLPVPVRGSPGRHVQIGDVADVRIVEGPATIKSENGLLRNYVRLNVRGRDSLDFVEEAKGAVAAQVNLPPGVLIEWTGQFEHEQQASNTLKLVLPLVLVLIFLVLWLTYRDFVDALLIMVAVPGALAGGVFAQWLCGYKFSVTVWVGYIACFGMATATGIIMLVYLREALMRAGGIENLSLLQLRQVVLDGAVKRLRPKLLTECTMVLGLAPLLWTNGIGADVIKPMVVPVLGGILIADEVIDLLLPVLFFLERRRRWERLTEGNHRIEQRQPDAYT
jgi:Cu(I)/Ag(I) efflux system membrane protein CusA/SilA